MTTPTPHELRLIRPLDGLAPFAIGSGIFAALGDTGPIAWLIAMAAAFVVLPLANGIRIGFRQEIRRRLVVNQAADLFRQEDTK